MPRNWRRSDKSAASPRLLSFSSDLLARDAAALASRHARPQNLAVLNLGSCFAGLSRGSATSARSAPTGPCGAGRKTRSADLGLREASRRVREAGRTAREASRRVREAGVEGAEPARQLATRAAGLLTRENHDHFWVPTALDSVSGFLDRCTGTSAVSRCARGRANWTEWAGI